MLVASSICRWPPSFHGLLFPLRKAVRFLPLQHMRVLAGRFESFGFGSALLLAGFVADGSSAASASATILFFFFFFVFGFDLFALLGGGGGKGGAAAAAAAAPPPPPPLLLLLLPLAPLDFAA